MFNDVRQKCQNYYDHIPSDTLPKMVRSALYTFGIAFVINQKNFGSPYNMAIPLAAAGMAAVASLIYALTTPIFNMVFGDNRILFHRELIKQLVNISFSSTILNYVTTGKVNLFSLNLLGGFSCNIILGLFEIAPTFVDWLGATAAANELREEYKYFGIDAEPGSSSVFLNFGLFSQ